jgi:hypothetical protein
MELHVMSNETIEELKKTAKHALEWEREKEKNEKKRKEARTLEERAKS